jgi:hypothetical protein
MKSLPQLEFLRWASGAGMEIDPRYPQSAVLRFHPDPDEARFWCVPAEPECRSYFIASLLELMGDWRTCYAWRHLGRWPDSADPRRVNDVVELCILRALQLPLGTSDVVEFAREELDKLLTLILSTTIFGCSVGEDLYVVPDHGAYILKTDHHDVIHVAFRGSEGIDRWVSEMASRGFPLPDELPDATFKSPRWMKPKAS